ncbi:MAG TPA: mannose-1-phosphate guanylyltransferase [Bacteroidales bacterium]|nr:mannose-1-phosphate guanylyltransferase [Bacteroidales bacterium]
MKQDYCVIMAGGIGSRFWPISRSNMPKQFLDIMKTGRTLIQQTFDRMNKIIPADNIYVVTNEEYRKIVNEQLPSVPDENILCEPMRRNTAPCILYSNIKIGQRNPEANIVVTPADHLIVNEDEFLKNISEGLDFIKSNDLLLTFGITPDRPATGYGYIQIANDDANSKFVQVKTFTEKPHLELAKFFLSSGDFLWNSGIFLWKQKSIEKAFKEFLPEMFNLFIENKNIFGTKQEKAVINRIYSDAKSISIDFGVMEKAQNVCVLKTDFGWSDLGTWNSLYSLHDKDENHNVVVGDKVLMNQSFNNYINTASPGKVVLLHGIEDLIVVDTETALLICKRENEQQISDLLNEAKLKFGDGIK